MNGRTSHSNGHGADGARTEGPAPISLAEVLAALDERLAEARKSGLGGTPTGFDPLDEVIGGGLQRGDLFLVAGSQGTGKTTLTLQMARNIAASDLAVCIYVCYEHDEVQLLTRLLALESSQRVTTGSPLTLRDVQQSLVIASRRGSGSLESLAAGNVRLAEALDALRAYQDRLLLLQGSGRGPTEAELGELVASVRKRTDKPVVLFVDYLQKVPTSRDHADATNRVSEVTQALKDLAIQQRMPIVAIAALDTAGLQASRLHVHHLWGGSALAYEADAIVMLADKVDVVARVNFEFNPQRVQEFREWVVASVVKNRSGRSHVDIEFRKRFNSGAFDPRGGFVSEKLIDERTYRE